MLHALFLVGLVAEGMTGALAAGRRRMDLFGVVIIASATAIGGGTIRDLLIGATPVFWIKDSHYLLTIALTAVAGMGIARVQHRFPWYILPLLDAAEKAYGGKLDILLSPLESAGLHEDQWRAEQRRQIKAGIPEALGRVYLPLH